MSTATMTMSQSSAALALQRSVVFWFSTLVLGQWLFVAYILSFYGSAIATGNPAQWNENTFNMHGYLSGDALGNFLFGAHVLLAASITIGGTLQLVPQIRSRALDFHRWNGRVYIASAIAITCAGLYLMWVRESYHSVSIAMGNSFNAALIFFCIAMAGAAVRRKNIENHRRWAIRAFLCVSATWFTRVGMLVWVMLNQGPVGVGENFDGPFVVFLSYANCLIPLAILECYLRSKDSDSDKQKRVMAAGLTLATVMMAGGVAGVFAFQWRPFM